MPEFRYARSRIVDSIRYLSEEMKEFQDDYAERSLQRNRLAHRYLNFRWQTIRAFSEKRELIARVADLLLRKDEPDPAKR